MAAPAAVAAILVPVRASFHPVDAALVLTVVVVAIAASGFRIASLVAAVSAAFWLDFFLIPPYQSLTGTGAADYETILLLLAVGAAVSELALRGRRQRVRAGSAHRHLDLLYEASVTIGTTLDMTGHRRCSRRPPSSPVAAAVAPPARRSGASLLTLACPADAPRR